MERYAFVDSSIRAGSVEPRRSVEPVLGQVIFGQREALLCRLLGKVVGLEAESAAYRANPRGARARWCEGLEDTALSISK